MGVQRSVEVHTGALGERGLVMGAVRLERRQRCSLCGDLKKESEHTP